MPGPNDLWRMPISYGGEATTPLDELREVLTIVRAQAQAIAGLQKQVADLAARQQAGK